MQSRHTGFSKTLFSIIFILLVTFLLGASKDRGFVIVGLKGKVLKNVGFRLSELYSPQRIIEEPIEILKQQIEKAMQPYGYFAPIIGIEKQESNLVIHIDPGPRLQITHFSLTVEGDGATNAELVQTIKDLPIKEGDFFDTTLYEESKNILFSAAEHQGYLHAKFDRSEVLIDRKSYSASISLIFNTGPQYYFGQIQFDPTYISPELIARYVPFKFGEPYSTDKVLALNSNLLASGYFKSVVVKPMESKQAYVPIEAHLTEAERVSYFLGVGYGTDTGPRGRAGLNIIPVNRYGHKFNAVIQGSFKENAIMGQYIIPGKNPLEDNYTMSGSFANLNYPVGYSNSLLFALGQQHIKNNFQRTLTLNFLDERFNYFTLPKTTKDVLFPKALFTWKHVEDQLFSPSGYNITLIALGASKALLSDINLFQASADAKAAITFPLIKTRFFFHTIQATTQIGNIYDLPLSLAPLLGGAETLKAYSYNSIGPGKVLSFGSIEIQKETFKKWYALGFIDAGDVYDPDLKHFKYDLGIGLMWVSPIGPIKIGVAQAVDNQFRRDKDRNPKLVINMGPDL